MADADVGAGVWGGMFSPNWLGQQPTCTDGAVSLKLGTWSLGIGTAALCCSGNWTNWLSEYTM